MRLGVVRGTVVLNTATPSLEGLRLVIVEPVTAARLATDTPGGGKCLIAADQLGAGVGQMVGFAEGRTAASPWYPNDIPVDAYCALIVENLNYSPPGAAMASANGKLNGKKTEAKQKAASRQKVRS
jgi:microcompartment protein CcmK/EutM